MDNKQKIAPRNMSLDLLRIIAMLMVIILHTFGYSGLLSAYPALSLQYNIVWFVEFVSIVAVNCYVMLSGYFLVTSRFKLARLFSLVGEVLFYSVVIYGLFLLTGKATLDWGDLLRALLPVIGGEYWFVTAYVGMYVLAPFMNKLINGLSQLQHRRLIVGLVALFSLIPTFIFFGDDFGLSGNRLNFGCSTPWFLVLYVIAAYVRRWYRPTYEVTKYLRRYGVTVAVSFGIFLVATFGAERLGIAALRSFAGYLTAYNSVTILLCSIALFLVFVNLQIKTPALNKAITVIAPLTLATYLIHENPHVRSVLWSSLDIAGRANSGTVVLYIVACVAGIYGGSLLIDAVRRYVFTVILRLEVVKKMGLALESMVMRRVGAFERVVDALLVR